MHTDGRLRRPPVKRITLGSGRDYELCECWTMATLNTSFFGLSLSGVPLINIRLDFNSLLALFRDETFRKQFKGYQGEQIPVKTHYFTWHGRPNTLLTYLLRDSIVGLESAVSGAVFVEALDRDIMTDDLLEATKNPFSLKKRGTAACVYIGLPELIDPSFSLQSQNTDLWERIQRFYKEVRNPIFHAYEIDSDDPEPVWMCLELLWEVFQWLNSWHPIEKLMSGPIVWNPDVIRSVKEIPTLDTYRVKQIIPERVLPESERERLEYLPKDMSVVLIEEVEGLYIGTEEVLDIGMREKDGTHLKVLMSPHTAMRLLGFLALAQHHRGWEVPDAL